MRLLVRKFKLIEVICVCLGEEYEQRAINNTRLAIPTRFHRVCYIFVWPWSAVLLRLCLTCICIGYDQKINHCLRLYWSKAIVIVFFFPSVSINNRYYHWPDEQLKFALKNRNTKKISNFATAYIFEITIFIAGFNGNSIKQKKWHDTIQSTCDEPLIC